MLTIRNRFQATWHFWNVIVDSKKIAAIFVQWLGIPNEHNSKHEQTNSQHEWKAKMFSILLLSFQKILRNLICIDIDLCRPFCFRINLFAKYFSEFKHWRDGYGFFFKTESIESLQVTNINKFNLFARKWLSVNVSIKNKLENFFPLNNK